MNYEWIGVSDDAVVKDEHAGNAYLLLEDIRKAKADRVSLNRYNNNPIDSIPIGETKKIWRYTL